ncbi:MAG: hypothetical protein GY749_32650 [Desulfobacteraceae bacterium]|nr:hypothetical protein [Desulfobacteraceae bacterium]
MKADISKMQDTNGYLQGNLECVDESLRELPFEYKKKLARSFYSINSEEISSRISGKNFYASKKIDGHLQLLIFNGEQIFIIGRSGTVRTGLPCLEEAKSVLAEKKISSIIAGAELYMQKQGERARVYDVISALSDEQLISTLGIAIFDIIEINGQSMKTAGYDSVFKKLSEIFPKTGKVHVVETEIVKSKTGVQAFSDKWINEEGAEGLVVRGDMPFMYKIKPKHTFDAIIVGYVEGINERKKKVKTLLFAFMREPGIYHVVGKVGNNLSEKERKEYFKMLSEKHIDSTYIETDNDGVAFRMVQPEIVIEVGCNDIMTENTYGKPLMNNVIKFDENRYSLYNTTPGLRFIHPMVERIREDKSNTLEDIRFSQLTDLVFLPEKDLSPDDLPESSMLFREVYKKTAKDKIMVQKFVVWKTNKETVNPKYPGYVMHYTNFSSNRKEPLQKDVRISSSETQIMELAQQFIGDNIKKGWELEKSGIE